MQIQMCRLQRVLNLYIAKLIYCMLKCLAAGLISTGAGVITSNDEFYVVSGELRYRAPMTSRILNCDVAVDWYRRMALWELQMELLDKYSFFDENGIQPVSVSVY